MIFKKKNVSKLLYDSHIFFFCRLFFTTRCIAARKCVCRFIFEFSKIKLVTFLEFYRKNTLCTLIAILSINKCKVKSLTFLNLIIIHFIFYFNDFYWYEWCILQIILYSEIKNWSKCTSCCYKLELFHKNNLLWYHSDNNNNNINNACL